MALSYYYEKDFRDLEDRLAEITRKVGEVRKSFARGEVDELHINLGTFIFDVGDLDKRALDLETALAKERTKQAHVYDVRARRKAEAERKARAVAAEQPPEPPKKGVSGKKPS